MEGALLLVKEFKRTSTKAQLFNSRATTTNRISLLKTALLAYLDVSLEAIRYSLVNSLVCCVKTIAVAKSINTSTTEQSVTTLPALRSEKRSESTTETSRRRKDS
jgi:hypothetical protein